MPLFENYEELHQGALQLYYEGKRTAAALRWARAKEAARSVGNRASAFQAATWEADSWKCDQDFRRALELLVPLLADVPHEALDDDRWRANTTCVEVQLRIRPERARLKRLMGNLERLTTTISYPQSDIDVLRGSIAWYSGTWKQALHHYSQGWHNYNEAENGFAKHVFPYWALQCCLRLANREDASSWHRHLSQTLQKTRDQARQYLKAGSVCLALYDGDLMALHTCLTNGFGYRYLKARAHLLLRGDSFEPLHDPSDPAHPAHVAVRPERTQNVHQRYDNLLTLVDYRLACIRFAAGLPAVDDLYYRCPDIIPDRLQPAAPLRLVGALQSFEISWRLLRRHAMRVDELLQCDWRTQEVNARRQRCDVIAQACGTERPR